MTHKWLIAIEGFLFSNVCHRFHKGFKKRFTNAPKTNCILGFDLIYQLLLAY